MTILLLLNILGAFNNILYKRLIYILKLKRILSQIIVFIQVFIKNKRSIIILNNFISKRYIVNNSILQGLLLLLILFLLFNLELVDTYNNLQNRNIRIEFIDNINILVQRLLTEANYRVLAILYNKYITQAKRYSISFNLNKYQLLYLLRAIKKFNIQAILRLGNIKKELEYYIKILRLQIDPKLKQGLYRNYIRKKISKTILILVRIIVSKLEY